MRFIILGIAIIAFLEVFYLWKSEHDTKGAWISLAVSIVAFMAFGFFNHRVSVKNEAKKESIAKISASNSESKKKVSIAKEKAKSVSESKEAAKDSRDNLKNADAFLSDFNTYLNNKNAGQAVATDNTVTVTMPDTISEMTVADFKTLAQDTAGHALTLAEANNYSFGLIEFKNQSGTKLARTTLSGDIKINGLKE